MEPSGVTGPFPLLITAYQRTFMKQAQRLLATLSVVTVSLFSATGAQAQSTTSPAGYSIMAPGNSYLDLGVGRAEYSLSNGLGGFNSDKRDSSYSLRAGSYVNNMFGMDAGYTDFGDINRGGGRTQANGLNLSLIGKLPLSEQFNILGKVGTTYSRTEVSASPVSGLASGKESGFGLSYGLGVEFNFTPQWSAVMQYEEHKMKFAGGETDRVGNTSLSARYRF
jgi:opacity protein-like surface antigen